MRIPIGSRLAALLLIVVAVLFAPPTGRVTAQIAGDLPTNWIFNPVGVTNRQVVRLTYANTLPVPVTISMEILGGKVNGATWTAALLAAQKGVVLQPGQATVLLLDW